MCAKGFSNRFPLSKLNKKSTQQNEFFGKIQRQQRLQDMRIKPRGKSSGRGR
jgi:hypothetical protein